jgi:hypothetical protein
MGTCLQFECQWARSKANRALRDAPRRLSARAECCTESESNLESAWPLPGTALPGGPAAACPGPGGRRRFGPCRRNRAPPVNLRRRPPGLAGRPRRCAVAQPVSDSTGPARPTAGLPAAAAPAGRPGRPRWHAAQAPGAQEPASARKRARTSPPRKATQAETRKNPGDATGGRTRAPGRIIPRSSLEAR